MIVVKLCVMDRLNRCKLLCSCEGFFANKVLDSRLLSRPSSNGGLPCKSPSRCEYGNGHPISRILTSLTRCSVTAHIIPRSLRFSKGFADRASREDRWEGLCFGPKVGTLAKLCSTMSFHQSRNVQSMSHCQIARHSGTALTRGGCQHV